MRPSRTQKWAPSCPYPPRRAPRLPWPPSRMLCCPASRQRGLDLGVELPGQDHAPSVLWWLTSQPPALMQDLLHLLLVPLPLLWPELSRNAPDQRHNPPAVGRAGQARPAPSRLHARDPERGGAGSEDEGGRAAQVQSGPSSYHHTEGNPPAPRKKSRAVTSSRKPA